MLTGQAVALAADPAPSFRRTAYKDGLGCLQRCFGRGGKRLRRNHEFAPGLAVGDQKPLSSVLVDSNPALRHQAWMASSQSCGPVSLPPDATVQQQAQAVVGEVAEAVPDALDLLDKQIHGLGWP